MKKQMSLLLTVVLLLSIIFAPSYTVQAAKKNSVSYWVNHKDTKYKNDYTINNKVYKCYENNGFAFYTTANGKLFVKNKNTLKQLSKMYSYEKCYKISSIDSKIEHIEVVQKIMKNSKALETYCNIIGETGAVLLTGASVSALGGDVLKSAIKQFSSPVNVINGIALDEMNNSKADLIRIKKDIENKKNLNSKYIDELIKTTDRANSGIKASYDLLSYTAIDDVSKWNAFTSFKMVFKSFTNGLGANWIDKMEISNEDKQILKELIDIAKKLKSKESKTSAEKIYDEINKEFNKLQIMNNYFDKINEDGFCNGVYNDSYIKTLQFYKTNKISK